MSEHAWLEPIRTAATAIVANPPSLTEWEAGEEGESEVVDSDVEKLLQELGWPTRTRTHTVEVNVFGAKLDRPVPRECTERYFPATWHAALANRIAEYIQARDADKNPDVPEQLRLRNLPRSAGLDAVRNIIEGAWDHAWDELACSVAVMYPHDAMGLDCLRYNFSLMLCESLDHPGLPEHLAEARRQETFKQRMTRMEADMVPGFRELPSPKWRAWFRDTTDDRIAIHETLDQCGVEVTGRLGADLQRAGYALDMAVTDMSIVELVNRVETKHRLIASAFQAARSGLYRNSPSPAGFNPCRASHRPADYTAIMETVGRLRDENTRWKEIREEVLKTHGYRADSEEAIRKQYERWQKGRKRSG